MQDIFAAPDLGALGKEVWTSIRNTVQPGLEDVRDWRSETSGYKVMARKNTSVEAAIVSVPPAYNVLGANVISPSG